MLRQIAKEVFKRDVNLGEVLLTRLAEHQFIHGGCVLEGGLTNVLYFEDVQTGVVSMIAPAFGGKTQFVRFSTRKVLHNRSKPSPN
jgi:hypothetical protein